MHDQPSAAFPVDLGTSGYPATNRFQGPKGLLAPAVPMLRNGYIVVSAGCFA